MPSGYSHALSLFIHSVFGFTNVMQTVACIGAVHCNFRRRSQNCAVALHCANLGSNSGGTAIVLDMNRWLERFTDAHLANATNFGLFLLSKLANLRRTTTRGTSEIKNWQSAKRFFLFQRVTFAGLGTRVAPAEPLRKWQALRLRAAMGRTEFYYVTWLEHTTNSW